MSKINEILDYIGEPYRLSTIDEEIVICRRLENFELEVSGLHKRSFDCIVYVWMTSPYRELVGIYSGIRSKEDLKDILGYCSVKYQNVLSRILVEREDRTE